jgi:hypothetical protein
VRDVLVHREAHEEPASNRRAAQHRIGEPLPRVPGDRLDVLVGIGESRREQDIFVAVRVGSVLARPTAP